MLMQTYMIKSKNYTLLKFKPHTLEEHQVLQLKT